MPFSEKNPGISDQHTLSFEKTPGKEFSFLEKCEKTNYWIFLSSRSLIELKGKDIWVLLQGLSTGDFLSMAAPQEDSFFRPHRFAAMLTPQGRFLADFFGLFIAPDHAIIDVHKNSLHRLLDTLNLMKSFHAIESIQDISHRYAVCAAIGPDVLPLLKQSPGIFNKILYKDLRHQKMGLRSLISFEDLHKLPCSSLMPSGEETYHAWRIHIGIPEGGLDLIPEKSIILEYGYHHMDAISWTKGCYMGQELIARTFYQGTLRKTLAQIEKREGSWAPPHTDLYIETPEGEKERFGTMGYHHAFKGLACTYGPPYFQTFSKPPQESLPIKMHPPLHQGEATKKEQETLAYEVELFFPKKDAPSSNGPNPLKKEESLQAHPSQPYDRGLFRITYPWGH